MQDDVKNAEMNSIFSVQACIIHLDRPYKVKIRKAGQSILFEFDVGSPVTIIREHNKIPEMVQGSTFACFVPIF